MASSLVAYAWRRHLYALAVLCAGLLGVEAYNEMDKFLIVSSTATHQIAYAPLPQDKLAGEIKLRTLISEGLKYPQGVAVDAWRKYLYVADPSLNKLVYYVLDPRGGEYLYVGEQKVAATGVDVRWVTVDGLGNVYFTVESTQSVMRIPAAKLDRGITSPEVIFKGTKSSVSAPGGIAIDNYYAYWTNKANPDKEGTLIRSLHAAGSPTKDMTKLNVKTYGVCMAANNIFFTAETQNLYGMSRLGGNAPTNMYSSFQEARGCAWDGMNTVFVADKKANAIYSFPANMPNLAASHSLPLQKVTDMEGAYGVAVYTVSESAFALTLTPSLLASVLLPALVGLLPMGLAVP